MHIRFIHLQYILVRVTGIQSLCWEHYRHEVGIHPAWDAGPFIKHCSLMLTNKIHFLSTPNISVKIDPSI